MAPRDQTLRICKKGHRYYKSTDCPGCPVCEAERKPTDGFLSLVSAPARRALEREKITTLQKLSTFSENELLTFHGFGPGSLPPLKKALEKEGLSFKK